MQKEKGTKKILQRNLKGIFNVEVYQNFVRERVQGRKSNATDERQRRYNEYLRNTPLLFSEVNILGLTIEVCKNYDNLKTYVDNDLSSILSVTSDYCQSALTAEVPTSSSPPVEVPTSSSPPDEILPPQTTSNIPLVDISTLSELSEYDNDSSSPFTNEAAASNYQLKEGGGGTVSSNSITWAKVETSRLTTSDYQTHLETEFGATDEAKELIQVISTLSDRKSIQWGTDSFLRLLKKSIPRYKDISTVVPRDEIAYILSPQICFICRYVPKFLRCFQKAILGYLLHHVSQDQEADESRVSVDAVDYLRFIEDGEFGSNFLKEKVTVLSDACGLIELKDESSDFFFHKDEENGDIYFQFNTKVENDSALFLCTKCCTVTQFCDVMSFFVSSNVFWPSVSSRKKSTRKKKSTSHKTKKRVERDIDTDDDDDENHADDETGNVKNQTSVPFFTNKLLYKMIIDLQNNVPTTSKELFHSIRSIIHGFLYNIFIIILIARLNIVYLLNSKEEHEFVGEMFTNSELFLKGLEENDYSKDDRNIIIRKLEYYSILLKYCFTAVEHIIYFLGLHVSKRRNTFPSEEEMRKMVHIEKESRLQYLQHLSELCKEKQ